MSNPIVNIVAVSSIMLEIEPDQQTETQCSFRLDVEIPALVDRFYKDGAFTPEGCIAYLQTTISGMAACMKYMTGKGYTDIQTIYDHAGKDLVKKIKLGGDFTTIIIDENTPFKYGDN